MNHYASTRKKVEREKFILKFCEGKKVLHLGCADWPYTEERIKSGTWLHSKITEVASECMGVDLDENTVFDLQNKHGINNVIQGNAEELGDLNLDGFDVVVAGEIIEHLNNPGLFLESAKSVLIPDGKLLITTTNAFCFRRFLRIPFGKESIHPDLTYYFSHTTLETLTKRFWYSAVAKYSYRIGNTKPLFPYIVEALATYITPNWGEGIVHVYSRSKVK
jgi:2-polyprenyl-3-methyl-5-hydroxy-6-metoxy-1,4-benzoquinol methylase